MKEAKITELAAKYLSGNIDAAERRELMEWVAQSDANQAFFDELIHVWSMTGDNEQPFTANTELAWSKVAGRISGGNELPQVTTETPRAKTRSLSIKRDLLRIAAVLLPLVAVAAWLLLQPDPVETRLIVSGSNTEVVVLPDGSRVTLNQNSSLSYLEDFTERKVQLRGEAFFEVARDTARAFEIYSEQTITRVLGTSFNVRAYPEEREVEVMVQTGTVEFRQEQDDQDRVVLTANEAAVFKKAEQVVEETTSLGANANAWMKKEIDAVDDVPLREMLRIINNYFQTDITVENPAALDCNVSIPPFFDPSLDLVIEVVTEVLSLEVDKSGKNIVLRGEGC